VQMNDSEPQSAAPAPAAAAAPALSTLHRKLPHSFLPLSQTLEFSIYHLCVAEAALMSDLKEIASVIEAGSLSKEVRRISRAFRLTVALRRRLAARDVSAFLAFALPASSEAYGRLIALVPKVKFASPLSAVKLLPLRGGIREARLWYSPYLLRLCLIV
jgi:26S proteasome regulatory subunit N3